MEHLMLKYSGGLELFPVFALETDKINAAYKFAAKVEKRINNKSYDKKSLCKMRLG